MIISIIGPSGCGKGTQARLLAEKLGVPAISGGEVLRREYKMGTPEGVAAEKYWGEGKWPPADLIMKIFKKRLDQPDCQNGLILDGAPREMKQIPPLEDYFAQRGQQFDLVLHLDTSDESCLSRLTHRIFAAREKGEKVRADEDPQEVRERLQQYHQTVEPVLKYFEEKGILRRINNEQPIERVLEDIVAVLNSPNLSTTSPRENQLARPSEALAKEGRSR